MQWRRDIVGHAGSLLSVTSRIDRCGWLEREVIERIKRAKLFVWLREHRHELFDADFQAELAKMYQDKPVG
jgi:hypothetical protein